MSFVHLHVHSEYSLLDGFSRIPALVKRAKELDMPALALTDHGAMFGVVDFYRTAKAEGIKPLIGIETYLAPRGMKDRDPQRDSRAHHLLLLAENDTGYRNLLKIATDSQLEGFYYRPRIDHTYLAAHSEGLICSTGCMSGEVPRALIEGRRKDAERLLDWYLEVFGRDRFFFELQHHAIPELPEVNKALMELAGRYQGNLVATNDVHYVLPEEAELQDILLCLQTGSLRADPDRMRMTDTSYYLRSPEEMASLFREVPEAVRNTLWIAERCQVDLDFKGYRLPHVEVPEGRSLQSHLRLLCEEGLVRRYGPRSGDAVVRDRLDYELRVIGEMGFESYFLIVWDLCRFARDAGIWYNARGSASGSIVAYCLEITLVDPLEHGLIFERFLNPGRISMPDIDLDFQDDKRYLLLEYAARRYGRDKVAQIITFGTLGARAAIRDVGRVLDVPLPEVDRVAKLIPNIPGKPVTIPETLETVPGFREIYDTTPYLRDLIDTASRLEGVIRNAGTHAAGVIITDKPITEYIPLHRPTGAGQENGPIGGVTQFDMQVLESLGLLKIDLLGLSTLTVMERACDLIRKRRGVELTIHTIPLNDAATYELLGRGDVHGVFQVEGAGMRRYLMDMKPRTLAHVTAMVALYRPGPMEFIPSYIRRMHNQERVAYRHPALQSILEETYGITVYQEQIMYTAMKLAAYTATEADNLRKAVAKKKAEALHQERDKFVAGCVTQGIPEPTAHEIFDDWEAFARYGFPKGHAADYAVICVETAYLKTHYPVEYSTALMSVFKGDTAKVALYIADCRRTGFDVLPPDVNSSSLDFEIEDQPDGKASIRYGLGAVKNVGTGAAQTILEARRRGAAFRGLHDFAQRVDLRQVGKRALESLIRVGALDGFGDRMTLIDSLDRILSHSTTQFRAADVGQMSLFGAMSGVHEELDLPRSMMGVPRRQMLSWERELLGVYVSEHPLTPYLDDLARVVTHFSAELPEAPHEQGVCVAGEVSHIRPYQTRTGKPMGFITLEDIQGSIEVVVFSRAWAQVSPWLEQGLIVVVRGKVDNSRGEPKVLADEITTEISIVEPKASLPSAPDLQEFEIPPDDPAWMPGEEILDPILLEDAPVGPSLTASEPMANAGLGSPTGDLVEAPPPPLLIEGVPSDADPEWVGVEAEASPPQAEPPAISPSDRHMLTLTLRSTGDRERDARRMRRVHGVLTSSPGQDRFAFLIFEASRSYYLEFPNSTTGYTPDLYRQLLQLLGTGSVQVEPLRIQ